MVMNQIEKWQKQYKTVSPTKGGYSDIRLWPCYMIFTGLVLFLTPYIGMAFALIILTIPYYLIARKVADIQNSNPDGVKQYEARIYNFYKEMHIKSYMRKNGLNRPRVMARSLPQAAEAKQSKQLKSIGNVKLSPQFTR